MTFAYDTAPEEPAPLGLIVLKADETIESDFRRMLPATQPLYISRVPSAPEVSSEALAAMAAHLTDSSALLPEAARFSAIGYGCTSASAEIGATRVAELIRAGAQTARVTDPLSALIAACDALSIARLAFLSPYVAEVSDKLRAALREKGIETPAFGSFDEPNEAAVVRISPDSTLAAATELAAQGGCDGVFLSCTNLRTLDVIDRIEADTGLPCLSSNQCLAWHMAPDLAQVPGKLGSAVG